MMISEQLFKENQPVVHPLQRLSNMLLGESGEFHGDYTEAIYKVDPEQLIIDLSRTLPRSMMPEKRQPLPGENERREAGDNPIVYSGLPKSAYIRAYRSLKPTDNFKNELNAVLNYQDEQDRTYDLSFDWQSAARGIQRAVHIPSFQAPDHSPQGEMLCMENEGIEAGLARVVRRHTLHLVTS
jgi:hypothetical protein